MMDFSSTLIRRHLLEVFSNCFKCYHYITVDYYYSYYYCSGCCYCCCCS